MSVIISVINEYFLLLVLAVGAVGSFIWIDVHRDRLGLGHVGALILSLIHTAYGVFCVRFFAFLESGGESFDAMSLYGAIFFMPVLYFVLARFLHVDIRKVFDLLTPCTVYTLLCSRFNCLHSGCCLGLPIAETGLRWPTREIEIVYYILFLACMYPMIDEGLTEGEVYPLYVMTYSSLRFVIEWMRVYDGEGIMHRAHAWALISLLIASFVYFELQRNSVEKEAGVK